MFRQLLSHILPSSHSDTSVTDRRIDHLDGWRGLAISLVLLQHFFIPIDSPLVYLGLFGVDVFFVLSGMLMSKILFENRMPLDIFYKRRISRIFPVFFVFIVSLYSIGYLTQAEEAENFLYSLFFLRTYLPLGGDIWKTDMAIGHLWSLNVEEHCYILLSLITLIRFFRGREYVLLIFLGLLSIGIKILYKAFPDDAPADGFLQTEAAASMLLLSAGYYLIHKKIDYLVKPWMIPVAFIGALVIASQRGGWIVTPFLLVFTVNHLHHAPKLMMALLNNVALRVLGVLSYSIYLWQQPLYKYLVKGKDFTPLDSVTYLIIAILVGVISYFLIEKHARAWLNKYW